MNKFFQAKSDENMGTDADAASVDASQANLEQKTPTRVIMIF